MYRIGVVSTAVELTGNNQEVFRQNNYQLDVVKEEELSEELPHMNGVVLHETGEQDMGKVCDLLLSIKQKSSAFIWIIVTKTSAIHRKIYLELGADGLFEPQHFPEELFLHMRNVFLRRETLSGKKETSYPSEKQGQELLLNLHNLSLFIQEGNNHQEISLTKLEYQLLELLFSDPGKAFSYNEIFDYLWQGPLERENYRIANIVFHIREKLKNHGLKHNYIRTVRSKGYMICRKMN